jgi:hypothetical protein
MNMHWFHMTFKKTNYVQQSDQKKKLYFACKGSYMN